MSLSVDGFWQVGFWSQGFWADGFWYEPPGGGGKRKRKTKPIRFSDFETKQQRIEAMARAIALNAVPLSQPIAQIEDEIEDDEAILLAAIRTLIH